MKSFKINIGDRISLCKEDKWAVNYTVFRFHSSGIYVTLEYYIDNILASRLTYNKYKLRKIEGKKKTSCYLQHSS